VSYTHAEISAMKYVDCLSVHRFKPGAMGYREKMTYLVGLLKEKERFADPEFGVQVEVSALADGIATVKVQRAKPGK
jgi:hypothetical protein